MIPPPNDWTELKTAFTELVDLAPDERAVRLAAITASDSALGTRLAVLLDADTAADRQLARFELLSAGVADTQHGPREEASADPLGLCGRTVAHFRIHDVLGSGGMGVAYRAEDQRLGRSVALKFLLPQLTADADATRDFLHEARTASALDHPNICTLLEVGESPHGLFLAMPAYAGETLQQRLARDGRIPVAEAVGIARQVLQGLAAAHAAGVTHRDLKPGNLMLTPDGTVKILDFGLARSADLEISASGARAGTIAYMSPEQVRGEAVDRRGDLWAVGVVLYQMLTGERPFGSGRDLSTLYAILHDDPPPLSARAPDVPPQLDAVVARLLRRDADERYADAAEAIAALDETTAGTPGGRVSTSRRRRRFVLAAVILMAAAAAVVPFVRRAGTTGPEVVVEQASVAVLPFTDTSPQRDQQHLGEGVAEEILNALVAVPGLRVPARGSSFRFSSDDDVPMGELARRLGVGALLEGTVHRDGDRIRISARLLDARTGRYLWSQTFDRRFRDIFAVQADIARTVAEALEVHLTADAQRAQPTQNIVAYELYLRGLFHWNRRTPHDLRQAIDFFTQATRHDTTYAQPYAGLALSHAVLAVLQPAASDLPGRTHEPAARALRLDSTLAEAHAARGYAYHWQWRWREAERELERAISLNPAYATAHQWYGEHLTKMGRVREGVAHVQRAIELDPLSLVAQSDLGLVLMLSGRLAESIAQFEHVRRLDPAFPLPLLLLHRVHMFAGDTAAAAEAGRRWAEITGAADAAELMLLARATRDTTLRSEARAVLVRWQREPAPRWPDIAMYFMLLGDHDDALRALELALQARAPMLASMKVAPWMDPVREDPRFLAVLRQLDFP